jgi:hypothetical protein
MEELDYTGCTVVSSWDYDHNMRIRKLQGPAPVDREGEQPIEQSGHDQFMQIAFCTLFFILLWYVWLILGSYISRMMLSFVNNASIFTNSKYIVDLALYFSL